MKLQTLIAFAAAVAITATITGHATALVSSSSPHHSSGQTAGGANSNIIPLTSWNLYSSADPTQVYSVTAPNTVLGALVSNTNRYPFDPFFGKNLDLINESDFLVPWVWSTTFVLPPSLANNNGSAILLQLEGLNYKSELTINGVLVANDSVLIGAFRRYELDITTFVATTTPGVVNTIIISVASETHTPGEWRSFNADLSINFQDWNPHPKDLSMGIYREARIVIVNPVVQPQQQSSASTSATSSSSVPNLLATVDGVVVKTTLPPTLPGQELIALLNASFVVRSWSTESITTYFFMDFGFNVTTATGSSQRLIVKSAVVQLPARQQASLNPSETRVYLSWQTESLLVVENPTLWWPWQMGAQNLFDGSILAADGVTNLKTFTYGLRAVRTELNQGGALQFFINNLPLQFRGGGWNSDLFLRESSSDRLYKEFTMLREIGLNGIRLEGMLESDLFYTLADQFGLVLLPGMPCCDGWQNWSSWPQENYDIARRSVVDQARRLAIHPSVIGYFEASDSLAPQDVEQMYLNAFVEESWPNAIISSASQQVSNISGNPGVKMVGPYSWEPPTYWLVDGNGLENGNYGGAWGFLTEGGPGESPMTFSSWNRTVPQEHLWSADTQSYDSWWSYHMGEPFGHFRNLTFYTPPLEARYGASTSAQEFLFRAQAANYEGIRAYIESYSRNKHLNATGFVQWMINNAWPSHLWHLYDYYLIAGGGYYGAKKACEDLHAIVSYTDGSVWIINSRFFEFGEVSVTAEVLNLSGTILWTQTQTLPTVPSDASFPLNAMPLVPINGQGLGFTVNDTFFVRLIWAYQDPTTSELRTRENWYWFNQQPDVMDFPASNGFRTPCTSYTNYAQLTTGLSSQSATVQVSLATASPQQLVVTVTANANNTAVAFFLHLRVVNTTSGFDVAPQYWEDNFISLLPGASRTLTVTTVLDVTFPVDEVRVEAESWNSVVSAQR
ncbi:glycoside hydrolase, putative [Bodo saltans]|uniref:Glycoside hydrolase, putative n=1 Tax=Bodo saltans TaxID=75058 RepID=A0A0S4JJ38_BODSA|nr:glycoside hydrolase, putative [Bodo saltans]|eukprot:CUG89011.1 glycoside hydrolase, putative [Bodo saltans]